MQRAFQNSKTGTVICSVLVEIAPIAVNAFVLIIGVIGESIEAYLKNKIMSTTIT